MNIVKSRDPVLSFREACKATGFSRATLHRYSSSKPQQQPTRSRKPSPRKLTAAEEDRVLEILSEDRFIDRAPAEIVAMLMDEDIYVGSERSFYRIMHKHSEVMERRKVARRTVYAPPRLVATRTHEVWTWDITKLRGPGRLVFFHLYVIIDIYSRYVVGWLIADREDGALAAQLIKTAITRLGVDATKLTVHSDRGSAMKSVPVVKLLKNLGATKTHSRPYVSDDNPFIESSFKTMKYGPGFPEQFNSLEEAEAYLVKYFHWYNNEHRHSGIAMMTPAQVHFGKTEEVATKRDEVLKKAYEQHPERFVKGKSRAERPAEVVYINPPTVLPPTARRPVAETEEGTRVRGGAPTS
jgi:putative transposase